MESGRPLFTVFTPTYQRGHLLERLYKSLLRQRESNFEWIIVDDGSTDDTKKVIEDFIDEQEIKIKYFFKKNGGKHTAHNEALKHAEGCLFLVIDSDDELTDESLHNFKKVWMGIPSTKRSQYAGIIGNIESGDTPKTEKGLEGNFFEMCLRKEISGEKIHLIRTDLMKKNPFPVIEGEKDFMIEGIVWLKVTKDKKVIYSSYPYRTYNRDTSDVNSLMNKGASPFYGSLGKAIYCNEQLNNFKISYLPFIIFFIKTSIKLNRYSSHSGLLLNERIRMQRQKFNKLLVLVTYPLGEFVARIDRKGS